MKKRIILKWAASVAAVLILALALVPDPAQAQYRPCYFGASCTMRALSLTQPLTVTGGFSGFGTAFTLAGDGASTVVNAPTGNVTFRVGNASQWSMSTAALAPGADVTEDLGSTSARIKDGYIRVLKDASGSTRVDMSSSSALIFNGAIANAAAAIGTKVGNSAALTAGSDRYIIGFYSDSQTTAQAFIQSDGDFVTNDHAMTTGFVSHYSTAALPEGTPLATWRPTSAGYIRNLTAVWTAGTGGVTGVVLRVQNVTDSTTTCTCTATCTGTGNVCDCNAALTPAKTYQLQAHTTTDCTANPTNAAISVELAR